MICLYCNKSCICIKRWDCSSKNVSKLKYIEILFLMSVKKVVDMHIKNNIVR